jgi:sugar/nucleoside kinase (ribokinase family)
MPDIACLGLVVADVIGNPVTKLPKPGTLQVCRHISLHAGGCAVNTGSALAKLGFKTSLLGAVGVDGFASYLEKELSARGLNLKGLKRVPKASTSASMVIVNPKGERAFLHDVGANARVSERHIDWKLLKKHRHLHIGGSFLMPKLDGKPLARVLKKARALKISTSLDTVYNPALNWARILKPCLPQLDYFMPSYEEARQISGKKDPSDMASAFQRLGAGVVLIKMGAKGSFVHDGQAGLRVPAPRIKVVDSTGAGDAFCAGFLAGRMKGWSLIQSAQLGNVLGASCCLGVGAYAGVPDWKQARLRLKQWYQVP